jgi:phage shock protein PspC (stress-responsive transcriptional regulator)
MSMNGGLYRSRHDRMIAGVAGGLAEQLGLDSSLVRVGWVVLAIVSGGLLAVVYLVMMIVVPEEPAGEDGWRWAPPTDRTEAPPPPPGTAGEDAPAGERRVTDSAAAADEARTSGEPAVGTAAFASTGDRPTEAVPPPPPPPPLGSWRDDRRAGRQARRDERAASRAQRREERAAWRAEHRDPGGPIVLGVLLVLIGIWFLAQRYMPAADFDRLWPIAIVVVGVVLVLLSIRPGRREP